MTGRAVAALLAAAAIPCASNAGAQEASTVTAEEMIEIAREAYRPPGLRRPCAPGGPGEIVVCAPDPNELRVTPETDNLIPVGEPPRDGMPSAAHLLAPPPCVPSLLSLCVEVGADFPGPLLIDLDALPEALTPEEAARVFRAEDPPSPAAASPAAAP